MLSHPSLFIMVATKPEINVFTWELFVRKRTVLITPSRYDMGDNPPWKLHPGREHSALAWDQKINQKQEHAGFKTATSFLEKLGLKIFDGRRSPILPLFPLFLFFQIACRSEIQI